MKGGLGGVVGEGAVRGAWEGVREGWVGGVGGGVFKVNLGNRPSLLASLDGFDPPAATA